MKDISMCVKDLFHFSKYYDDIECRIVKTTQDGRSGLLKLYRNGVELPTRRSIWIDFVIINNKDTKYHVADILEIDGKAYDVTVTDDRDIVHYNGELRRLRQTSYAKQHGQPLPEDTLEIRAYCERMSKETEAIKPQAETLQPWDCMSLRTHKWVRHIVDAHPDWFDKPFSEMTNKDVYDAVFHIKYDLQYGN